MKKNVLLGITGSISAYKSAEIVRIFKKNGFSVRCILTDAGARFITATTLQTLSGNKVYREMFSKDFDEDHIALSKWADIILIAPASCDAIARIASGRCSDLLSATVMSSRCPVAICPAMNSTMWKHPATVENVKKLKRYGYKIIPPEKGELACGDNDIGRLPEPKNIFEQVKSLL